jgi:uncharacterized protein (DUF4415 family)
MPKSTLSSSKVSTKQSEWVDPDDIELTDDVIEDLLKNGEIREGDRVIRPGRPPLGDKAKTTVTIRLDPDVVEAYRALGAGWQTRINADLRKARKLKPTVA